MTQPTLSVVPGHEVASADEHRRTDPSPFRQLVKRMLTRVLPRRAFLVHGPRSSGTVCLTFDDGPHPEYTPALLDTLAEHDVHATFFLVGESASRHPQLVQRIAREGHAVGHHSYTHSPPDRTRARQLFEEVRRTVELLESITGEASRLFRPPHGTLTATKLVGVLALGQTVVLWSKDPKDSRCQSLADVHRVEVQPPVGGDIVLLHDVWAHTAPLAGEMIREIRGRGLTLDKVTTWL